MQLQGSGAPLVIEPAGPVQIIGERINPSGKAALRRALLAGNLELVIQEAQAQSRRRSRNHRRQRRRQGHRRTGDAGPGPYKPSRERSMGRCASTRATRPP